MIDNSSILILINKLEEILNKDERFKKKNDYTFKFQIQKLLNKYNNNEKTIDLTSLFNNEINNNNNNNNDNLKLLEFINKKTKDKEIIHKDKEIKNKEEIIKNKDEEIKIKEEEIKEKEETIKNKEEVIKINNQIMNLVGNELKQINMI
jgi:hypothetical protein